MTNSAGEEAVSGGALVALEAAAAAPAAPARPLAGFLTQLVACREGVPDFRARRRAAPQVAGARYAAAPAARPRLVRVF